MMEGEAQNRISSGTLRDSRSYVCRCSRQAVRSPAWLLAAGALAALAGHASVVDATDYEYVGCFRDYNKPNRVLPTQTGTKASDFSLSKCAEDCLRTNPDFKYCGLEYGHECYCGNSYDEDDTADNCDMYYDESTGVETGGYWAISIYDLSAPVSEKAVAQSDGATISASAYAYDSLGTSPSPSPEGEGNDTGGDTDVGGLDPVPSGERAFTVVNKCSQTIRVGSTGGRITFGTDKDPSDKSHCDEWGPSAVYNPGPMGIGCYWDLPDEDGGNTDRMLGPGESFRYSLHPTESDVRWSGTIWASTGCDKVDGCATGVCYSPNTDFVCPAYVGPGGPTTKAEFTLSDNGRDYYDVSAIDGTNLAMMIEPDNPAYPENAQDQTILRYRCGAPGAPTSTTGLAGCTWSYEEYVSGMDEDGDGIDDNLSPYLRLVHPPSYETLELCEKDADCSEGICGLHPQRWADGSYKGGVTQGSCGEHVAWVSAGGACAGGWESDVFPDSFPYFCGESVTNGQRANMYGCHGGALAHSGYTPGADSTACGCPDWESADIQAPAISTCEGINLEWVEKAQPWAQFLKKACPTAYTFPYDDQTSTFMCASEDNIYVDDFVNTQSYTITFCPGDSETAMFG